MPPAPLSDGTVTLRAWRAEGAGWYAEQSRDPEIQRFTTDAPNLDERTVRAAIERFVTAGTHASMVITDGATAALLGNIGLAPGDQAGVGSLSYWVSAAARGRGVASRSVRLLVDWGWNLGLDRIELYTHVDNTGSRRVAENAGFRFERIDPAAKIVKGRTWDIAWYAIDRPDAAIQREYAHDRPRRDQLRPTDTARATARSAESDVGTSWRCAGRRQPSAAAGTAGTRRRTAAVAPAADRREIAVGASSHPVGGTGRHRPQPPGPVRVGRPHHRGDALDSANRYGPLGAAALK
jgi:ribosomal-protein-alanine N-acetyltransferase